MELNKQKIIEIFTELKSIIDSDNNMLFYGSTHISDIIIGRNDITVYSYGDDVLSIDFNNDIIYEHFTNNEELINNYIEEVIDTFCSYSPNSLIKNIQEKHELKSI